MRRLLSKCSCLVDYLQCDGDQEKSGAGHIVEECDFLTILLVLQEVPTDLDAE